ncbi:MAG TPA: PAS domain S-box protein [Armatimonadaceae bacterium]|nr:PAS domain S-box protein [Armatimonadaceae bacterium]
MEEETAAVRPSQAPRARAGVAAESVSAAGPSPAGLFSPSKRFLRGVAEVTPALLYVYDLSERRNIYVNRQIQTTLGYTPEEIRAMGSELFARLLHPDDVSVMDAILDRASRLGDGEVAQAEYRLRHRDGSWHWFQGRDAVFRRAADGTALQIVGAALDVTERQEAEEALRLTESFLEQIVDNNAAIVFAKDLDGRYILFNRLAEQLTGLSADDVLGRTDYDIFGPEFAPAYVDNDRRVLDSGEPLLAEEAGVYPDGPHVLSTVKFPLTGPDGRAFAICGIAQDITARKRLEEVLRLSEERYRVLTLATNQVVWWTDAEGAVVRPAPLWGLFTGQLWEEYRGWGWLQATHPDDRYHVSRVWRKALAEQSPYECEYRLRHRDGGYRYTVSRAAPILDAGGSVVEWVGCNSDITESKQLETERETLLAKQTRVAEILQRSLLEEGDPLAFPGLRIEKLYEAASDEAQVGGDFYDTFCVSGGRAALVVGDVTGKGLDAASYTAEIKYTLRTLLREHGGDPALALGYLNRLLGHGPSGSAVTSDGSNGNDGRIIGALAALSVAIVDPRTGSVRVSSAGMEPPLLLRRAGAAAGSGPGANRPVEEMAAFGPLLGMDSDLEYVTAEATLEPGDVLLMVTDGITEARSDAWKFFGAAGVSAAAGAALDAAQSVEAVAGAVLSAAKEFAGGRLRDDACVLAVRRETPAPPAANAST